MTTAHFYFLGMRNTTSHNHAVARGVARKRYRPNDLEEVLRLVREAHLSPEKACERVALTTGFRVPPNTARARLRGPDRAYRPSPKPVLTDTEERRVAGIERLLLDIADLGLGLAKRV